LTPQELVELKRLIIFVAEYYGRELKPQTVTMMASDLEDLPFAEVKAAYERYRRDGKNDRFPIPGVIREVARPTVSNRGKATEAAARIIAAIRKHGWNNPLPAREYMGELAWKVVEMQGGWMAQCESSDPTGVLQAQWTKLAEAILEKGAAVDVPPGLPKPDKPREVGDGMARIMDLLPKGDGGD
jgi:hypothetical protein